MGRKNVVIGALLGAAAGLLVGLLLAPKAGRQTRAWIGAKARHGGKLIGQGSQFLKKRAEYEGNRLRGLFYETKRRLAGSRQPYASDDVVTQRVRTELGRHPKTRDVQGLLVDTFNGVVTIRGKVESSSRVKDILDVIYSVAGVRDVVNQLRLEQFV
ncbi:MAG: BON domain-containing protein [Acidobacteria bacterium]|nr:BON domain-containing protein [Acidobacteriota bacterium]